MSASTRNPYAGAVTETIRTEHHVVTVATAPGATAVRVQLVGPDGESIVHAETTQYRGQLPRSVVERIAYYRGRAVK